jgi:hypothetical protein
MNTLPNRRVLAALLTGLILMTGCQKDEPKTPRLQDALPGMPLPGDPVFVSRSGSEDALQVVFTTGMNPEEAATFYRKALARAPWTLVSDQPFESGGRVLYASRNGPPLWVTIKANPNGIGSQVSLNGAVAPKGGEAAKPSTPADSGTKPKP